MVEWEPGHRLAWDGPPCHLSGGAARPRGYFEGPTLGRDAPDSSVTTSRC
jgi:hypothetical protein